MVKQIALALTGVVLAFAVCRAAPVYEKVCKAPDVPRVELVSGSDGGPLICPLTGFCFHMPKHIVATYIRISCLTTAEEFEAIKRWEDLNIK